MSYEILKSGFSTYEVVDYYGDRMFEGTLAECEDFIHEATLDNNENSELD